MAILQEAGLVIGSRLLPQHRPEPDPKYRRAGISIVWPSQYDWPNFAAWLDGIRDGLAALVPLSLGPPNEPITNIVMVQFMVDGQAYPVAFDVGDRSGVDDGVAKRAALYLKMQYARQGYDNAAVAPAGFVSAGTRMPRILPALRAIADLGRFQHDVYGRFGTGAGLDVRRRHLDRLAQDPRFSFTGGLKLLRQSAYLTGVARSRICIDLPGNGDFCFRLIEYLAVGSAIVALRHGNRFPVELVDGRDIILVDDPTEMADACADLLRDDDRMRALRAASRAYYDRHLQPERLAAYYLDCFLDRLVKT
jgi:glycosyltransferase involved in cell wall biosynthesis